MEKIPTAFPDCGCVLWNPQLKVKFVVGIGNETQTVYHRGIAATVSIYKI